MRLIFLLAALAQATCPTAVFSAEPIIVQWSGQGLMTTRPFHLNGPGEVQWKTSGFLQIFLKKPGEPDSNDIIANQADGGPGSAYIPEGGDYYLTISALSKWSIKVVLVQP